MAHAKPNLESLREQFQAHGQGHVFAFWERLNPGERTRLIEQATRLAPRLSRLIEEQTRALAALRGEHHPTVEPIEAVLLPEHGGRSDLTESARQTGEAALAAGRVAAVVVAGGQGTRLGFPHPKGCFPVGPISQRSLFELQAQKLRGLERRIGRPVPWYVMTSEPTDTETREFFEGAGYFGLRRDDVFVFAQDTVPAFDFDERLMLEDAGRIFESPDGHGGSLTALADSGALDDMERRGVDTLFYYQVDNPLVRMADPVFLGLHEQARADMSCKVVRKRDPLEKVGLVARVNGSAAVVEYTELDPAHRDAREGDGLRYWAGNIAIHAFALSFVRKVAAEADRALPFHASAKKIPTLDDGGGPVAPAEPNGYKLERFVFDALPAAERVCVVEVRRGEDFSPIKNESGDDSPESALRDLQAQYRHWLDGTGVEGIEKSDLIEIDHSRIDGPGDAARAGITSLAQAGDAIRIAHGRDS